MKLTVKFAVVASDYGRSGGWVAEIDSDPVAELSDCRYEDMFWESYCISGTGTAAGCLQSDEFWNRNIVFRSKLFPGTAVTGCIARWRPDEQRLVVRSLYIHGVTLSMVESLLFSIWWLFWGRRFRHLTRQVSVGPVDSNKHSRA